MKTLRQLTLGLALASCFGSANAYINIVFDYTYDTNNFFTADRRATLEQAAKVYESRVFDDLAAITSTPGGNGLSLNFMRPDTAESIRLQNASIARNEVRIYVGGSSGFQRPTFGDEDSPYQAFAGNYGFSSTSTDEYLNTAMRRGQTGTIGPYPDFANWGGMMSFDSKASWYADQDVTTMESFTGSWDLYTVALKSLATVMGLDDSVNDSLSTLLSGGGDYNAPKGRTVYGVKNAQGRYLPIPMSDESGDFRLRSDINGKLANGNTQRALLAWGLSTGERRHMTELDWAIMDDIGWDVTGFTVMPETPPIPEPQTWAMLAAGLGLIGYTARKRRMM